MDEAPSGSDLDAQVKSADPDRWLATRLIADPLARADVIALYAYDAELARAPKVASNALIAEIRLTWWREVLDQIFGGQAVRRHPAAEALAGIVARYGLPRAPLEAMIDARIDALSEGFDPDAWADQVGGSAAVLAARILDRTVDPEAARPAGRLWGRELLRRAGRLEEARRGKALPADLSVRAFPAVAHVALRGDGGVVGKRLRLVWAALRGRA